MAKSNKKPNPFDPESLRITKNMDANAGVRKIMVHLPVQKPNKQSFFRLHKSADCQIQMAILELKDERETYAVLPDVAYAIEGETRIVNLRLGVTQQGTNFLWPVPVPVTEGRDNSWNMTARIAAEHAETSWVRMTSNMGAGCYDIKLAPEGMPEPEWPTETFGELIQIGFDNGKSITSLDHPVIKRLMGH